MQNNLFILNGEFLMYIKDKNRVFIPVVDCWRSHCCTTN